ncbi:MAG: hydantoinase/oxoprolinase N-terminal domain-containing protein, partial [Acidimicrobiales bacterium]
MKNNVKTVVLLAGFGALLMGIGSFWGQGGLFIGLAIGLVMVGGSYWFSDKLAIKAAKAQPVTEADMPQYYAVVRDLCQRSDMPMPQLYVSPEMQPNAFATGRSPKHAAVCVTQGILQVLDWDELRGVLAHEISHVGNRDILIGSVAAALAMAITFAARMAMWGGLFFGGRGGGNDRDNNIFGLLAMMILAPLAAMMLQMALSRSREYEADRSGARLVGDGEPLARALEKIEGYAKRVPMDVDPAQATAYIINPLTGREARFSNLFRTHPPTEDRRARLRNRDWTTEIRRLRSPSGCAVMFPGMRVGVDTGGTFTDAVAADGTVVKLPSTPAAPAEAVRAALGRFAGVTEMSHGTTVATNALLERRLARVALVTNRGLADVIEIARQDRPSLYDPFADRPAPLVPRDLRFEVDGRLASDGTEIEPLDVSALTTIPHDVDVVAVCLLHSDRDPAHEQAVGEVLRAAGYDVVLSNEVSPEFREYERMLTTVVDAALRPVCRAYLGRVGALAPEVSVMTSAGGLTDIAQGAQHPVTLALSGPAGGVRAAAAIAAANGWPDAISFDMGGTSTDVCLIRGGVPEPAPDRSVAGWSLRLPS